MSEIDSETKAKLKLKILEKFKDRETSTTITYANLKLQNKMPHFLSEN